MLYLSYHRRFRYFFNNCHRKAISSWLYLYLDNMRNIVIAVQLYRNCKYHMLSWHNTYFVVTDGNTGCHSDNFRCRQWRQKLASWQLSVFSAMPCDVHLWRMWWLFWSSLGITPPPPSCRNGSAAAAGGLRQQSAPRLHMHSWSGESLADRTLQEKLISTEVLIFNLLFLFRICYIRLSEWMRHICGLESGFIEGIHWWC